MYTYFDYTDMPKGNIKHKHTHKFNTHQPPSPNTVSVLVLHVTMYDLFVLRDKERIEFITMHISPLLLFILNEIKASRFPSVCAEQRAPFQENSNLLNAHREITENSTLNPRKPQIFQWTTPENLLDLCLIVALLNIFSECMYSMNT